MYKRQSLLFVPGSSHMNNPKRYNHEDPHLSVIYPRRDLASLIAACYPVVGDRVVMRHKPVFTTAAIQVYGGACCDCRAACWVLDSVL